MLASDIFQNWSAWDLVALGLFLYFVVLPLVAARRIRASTRPEVRYCGPPELSDQFSHPTMEIAPSPPFAIVTFFELVEKELAMIGFQRKAWLVITKTVENSITYVAVFRNEEKQDWATATACIVDNTGTAEVRSFLVEFTTIDEWGGVWDTNNATHPLGLRVLPPKVMHQIPGLVDLGKLYELHLGVLHHAGDTTRSIETEPDLTVKFTNVLVEDYQKQCEFGYMRRDDRKGVFSLRLSAVPYCVMGQLWPISAIRRFLMYRRALRTMEKLGHYGGYERRNYMAIVSRLLDERDVRIPL